MTVSLLKYRIRTRSGGIWDDLNERETDYQPTIMDKDEKIKRLQAICIGTEIEQEKQEAEVWNDDFLVMRFSYHPNFFYRGVISDFDAADNGFRLSSLALLEQKADELDLALTEYERSEKHMETVLDFETPDQSDWMNKETEKFENEAIQKLMEVSAAEEIVEIQRGVVTMIFGRYLNNG